MKLVLFAIFVAAVSYSLAGTKFAGPFDIQVKQPFTCEDEGSKDIYFNETTVRKKSRVSFVITTKVHTRIPFTDDITLNVNSAVWGNGGWRPNFLTMEYKEGCSAFTSLLPVLFKDVLDANNVTGCPIPPGFYSIVDADSSPRIAVPSLPYNKYKIYINFLKENGEKVGCLGMIAQVVPKTKKG